MDIDSIRREYLAAGLHRQHLDSSPIVQFETWLQQAIDAGLKDPTAMTLATVDSSGQPSQRIVLLKELDQHGFVFFTNYSSQKSQDIENNAKVSLHFPWHAMERQVKVLGEATKIPKAESLAYFVSRPHESQLAAWASRQSQRVDSRQFLLAQFQAMKHKFAEGKIPLPDFWGGYRVVPRVIEFWQGRESRLHDRFEYKWIEGAWVIERLQP
jgi:pyridoxamine 5'-phosphate oxidase